MKIRSCNSRPARAADGSVMVLTVVVTGLIGFALASYLQLVKVQNMATMRSQAWNATVPVIEAGVEDAMTHLNTHGGTGLGTDGWTQYGTQYTIQRSIGNGYYIVTISNYFGPGSSSPMIISRGYIQMPVQVVSSPHILFAATAGATPYLARGVKVSVGLDSLFAKGLVAKGQIDMNGNNIATDSFDSSDPTYSTGGQYDPAKRKANGHVATNSGIVNSLNVGNADIYGKVSTGPGGSVSVGNNGAVGDFAWHSGGSTGIQPGWSSDDMNVDFPDVSAPFAGGAFTPMGGVVGGTYYEYVLTTGNWQMNSLSMSSSKTMLVTGNATLYVTGNASLSGQAKIQIAPGGSLKMYVKGSTASLNGNGVVNQTGYATNFTYYGLPSNTSLSFGGNAEFKGIVYAPSAAFTMNGGGSSSTDFIGASITSTVTLNGHFKFHYDESLSKFGPSRGYIVRSWNEMTPDEVAGFNSYSYTY